MAIATPVSARCRWRSRPEPTCSSASPALFVANEGQFSDSSILYAFDGSGASVALGDSAIDFDVYQSQGTLLGAPIVGRPAEQFSVAFPGANSVAPAGTVLSADRL